MEMVSVTEKELNESDMTASNPKHPVEGALVSEKSIGPISATPEQTQAPELPDIPAPAVTPPDAGTKRSLIRKLAEVMAEIGWVEKRGKNTFFNYAYATESDILAVLRPSLGKRGVFVQTLIDKEVTADTGRTEGNKNDKVFQTNIWTRHIFHDGESGETMTINGMGRGEDRADKGIYKALTGAMKYAMSKAFLVSSGDDPEKEEGDEEEGTGTSKGSDKKPAGVKRASESNGEVIQEFEDQITDVSEKRGGTGKNAWVRFGIKTEKRGWVSTFNPEFSQFAQKMKGTGFLCQFKVKQDGQYLNLQGLEEILPPEVGGGAG